MTKPEQPLLPDEAVEEFKELYRDEYGKDISDAEARELGGHLLNLFDIVCRPIRQEWIDELMRESEGKWTTLLPRVADSE